MTRIILILIALTVMLVWALNDPKPPTESKDFVEIKNIKLARK